MTARRPILALAAPALAATLGAAAADLAPDSLLAALRGRYRGTVSVSARFTQVYRSPGVETVESGVLYLRRPALMRWEYQRPETKLFVADGRNTYLYTPSDRQVLVGRFGPRELRSTPLELLLGEGGSEGYRAAVEPELRPSSPGNRLVRLYPRAARPEYDFVSVELEAVRADLRRLVIREPTGASSEIAFADVRLNPPIDARRFRFEIPKGVEVIEVDGGGR